ncbi:MAG: DUF2974 domain-containing protein [Verrucomicrobia bacterium]|jgi:hypothetical protein|nr:DUF2974 domain-containing protein [Verrucomicrobiota bacterium]
MDSTPAFFRPKQLAESPPPTQRAYFSNRTAWLMAQMSRLAYEQFEPPETSHAATVEALSKAEDEDEIGKILAAYREGLLQEARLGRERLERILAEIGFELVNTYCRKGTEGFLAKRSSDQMAVLAFRGTQTDSLADIKTDLRAYTTKRGNEKTHTGFLDAFKKVKDTVEQDLHALGKDYAVYITGHSLGGALALVATKQLQSEQFAACYTFGSPRVGNSEFGDSIKTPIYRVVNTADIVPRLPPGLVIEVLVDLLRLGSWVFWFLEPVARILDDRVSGYRHHGDMRYLTGCREVDYSDVRIIQNISFFARIRRLWRHRSPFGDRIRDHGIEEYCRKLAAYVTERLRAE